MKRILDPLFFAGLLVFGLTTLGFTQTTGTGPSARLAPVDPRPDDLARSAVAAHGGEKLKKLRTLLIKGSVELNVMGQTMPGAFSIAFSDDKYFFEVVSAVQTLKQVYDGKNTSSSIQGFSLPPVTSLGFPLLPKAGEVGYTITALESKKKQRGFRITTPEGFYTDFIVDQKTGQIKGYESAYEVGGRVVTTSVEVKAYEVVDGITIPKNYAQRFDLGTLTAYANFKAKTILVNSPIEDAAFALK